MLTSTPISLIGGLHAITLPVRGLPACGSETLVLDKAGPPPRAFVCALCERAKHDLAKRLRKPSLYDRIKTALGFFASNDGEVPS